MTDQKNHHGLDQAKAQAESIVSMVSALNCDFERLEELREEREALTEAIEHDDEVMSIAELDARNNLISWDEDNAEELNTLEHEAGEYSSQDEARERIQEDALSVEVRSGWTSLGDTPTPEEFRIVLCTGGPHVEIRGEFGIYGTPYRAWLQYQDWGTPLTQYFDIEESTLLAYASCFYFGE